MAEKLFCTKAMILKYTLGMRFEPAEVYTTVVLPQFTVKDLIKELKKYPQNARPGITDGEYNEWLPFSKDNITYDKDTKQLMFG